MAQEGLHSLLVVEDTAGLVAVFHSRPAGDRSLLAVAVHIDSEAADCIHPEAGHSLAEEAVRHTHLGLHIRLAGVVGLKTSHLWYHKTSRSHQEEA